LAIVGLLTVAGCLLFAPGCKRVTSKPRGETAAPVESLHCVAAEKGEKFMSLLARFAPDPGCAQAIQANMPGFDIANPVCADGESLVGFSRNNKLYRVEYRQRYDRTCVFTFDSLRTRLAMTYHWVRVEPETYAGSIRGSLWMAMQNTGLKPDMIIRFAELFAWDVDFFTETQPGDSFKLIQEQLCCDERKIGRPQLEAGEYKGKCGQFYGYFYQDPGGRKDYYMSDGECVRKGFLRAPLKFERVTSSFSKGRYHPILGIVRPHLGVDYAAALGTPVSAIGDGIVALAGWSDGYGNLLEINHGGGYQSRYGHLSRFGRGIHAGVKVKQGQTIAYTGMTGLATGPHLHFEVRVNGVPHNPLKIIPPRAEPLARQYLPVFKQRADSLAALLNRPVLMPDTTSEEPVDSTQAQMNRDSTW
jgi:murein DD-endopeptidase MepM/ murein hydrolase activator NlpD